MNLLAFILVFMLRVYRLVLSPLLVLLYGPSGGGCRYTPTCSCYALEAVQLHGPFRGTWLTLLRLGRCHPWGGCGADPVPLPTKTKTETKTHSAIEVPNAARNS